MARRDGMLTVAIDEVDEHPAPTRVPGPGPWRRWWPFAAALAAVIAGGLLVTQTVLDARERSRLARVQAVPGVVRPLAPSVHELWRSNAVTTAVTAGVLFADTFVGGRFDIDGTQLIQALDAATGAVVWSDTVAGPDPSATHDADRPPRCSLARGDVVCLVKDQYASAPGTVAPDARTPRAARVVVIDAATGTIVAVRETPASSALAVDDDLAVVAWVTDDGRDVVTGTDPRTGEVRWTFTTPTPLVPHEGEQLGLDVTALDAGFLVDSSSHQQWLLSAQGLLLRELPSESASMWFVVPRTGLLTLRTAGGPSGSRTTVLVDGKERHALDGEPATVTVDDGSVPDLVFTGRAPLMAWDVTTGARRWTGAVATGRTLVLLDGTLYSATSDAVLALDASTGRVRWTAPARLRADGATVLTDGRVLVVDEMTPGPHLVAFDLADGSRVWSADLPSPVDDLRQVDGRLFGSWDDLAFIALG
jgi:outer membrane protein assembly factor BamB